MTAMLMSTGSLLLGAGGANAKANANAGVGGEGDGIGDAAVVDAAGGGVCYAVDGEDDQLRLNVEESAVGTACPWVFGWCYPNGRRV